MAKILQEAFEGILAEPAVMPSTSMLVAAVGEPSKVAPISPRFRS